MKFIPVPAIALAVAATLADMGLAGSPEVVKKRVMGNG